MNRPELAIAAPKAASLLGRPEAVSLGWLLRAIRDTTDPDALKALGERLGAIAAELSDSQAKEVIEPFLAAINGRTSLNSNINLSSLESLVAVCGDDYDGRLTTIRMAGQVGRLGCFNQGSPRDRGGNLDCRASTSPTARSGGT